MSDKTNMIWYISQGTIARLLDVQTKRPRSSFFVLFVHSLSILSIQVVLFRLFFSQQPTCNDPASLIFNHYHNPS